METTQSLRGEKPRCQSIIQPGDFTIDMWDGERCHERNPRMLLRCEGCKAYFCIEFHYRKHLESVPMDHFEAATS